MRIEVESLLAFADYAGSGDGPARDGQEIGAAKPMHR